MAGKIQPSLYPAAARIRECRKHRTVPVAPENPKIHHTLVLATRFPEAA